MSEWISTKDRLPNESSEYIVCQSGKLVMLAWFNSQKQMFVDLTSADLPELW